MQLLISLDGHSWQSTKREGNAHWQVQIMCTKEKSVVCMHTVYSIDSV